MMNMRGEIRFFVDPDGCPSIVEALEELDLKNGIPNKANQWIDYYDGSTYGAFRIWGTDEGPDFFGYPLIESLSDEENDNDE